MGAKGVERGVGRRRGEEGKVKGKIDVAPRAAELPPSKNKQGIAKGSILSLERDRPPIPSELRELMAPRKEPRSCVS